MIEDLLLLSRSELAERLAAGHDLAPADLAGWEYLGVSLGLPALVDRLAWKTFLKVFAPDGGGVRGWNVRLEQDPRAQGPFLERQHRPLLRRGAPWAFGRFRARPLAPGEAPRGLERGVMLDYGQGRNPGWDPVRLLRDPLVALRPGDPTLLLGWSYVQLGPLQLPTPSFFVLQRLRPGDRGQPGK